MEQYLHGPLNLHSIGVLLVSCIVSGAIVSGSMNQPSWINEHPTGYKPALTMCRRYRVTRSP
jgi:hypothetical protein